MVTHQQNGVTQMTNNTPKTISKNTFTTNDGTTVTVTTMYVWGGCPQCGNVKRWGVYTIVESDNPEWDTDEINTSFVPVEY